jgi:hypothetical protein
VNPNVSAAPAVIRIINHAWSGYCRLRADGTAAVLAQPLHGRWTQGLDGLVTMTWSGGQVEQYRVLRGELLLSTLPDPAGLSLPPYPCPAADAMAGSLARAAAEAGWRQQAQQGLRLGIVIPYRAREQHLARLLPHLISYFQRDLHNSGILPLIVVAEQGDAGKFNVGFCRNLGFAALRDHCDYVCFHDVDYLPMWADYSMPVLPTRIVWWGHHLRPIREAAPNGLFLKGSRSGLGAVALMDKAQFLAVNGYSNAYRGWGYEDDDLILRLALKGLSTQQRDGTFEPLSHDNAGVTDAGTPNVDWLANEARYKQKSAVYQATGSFPEGLSTLSWRGLEYRFQTCFGLDQSETATVCWLKAFQMDEAAG